MSLMRRRQPGKDQRAVGPAGAKVLGWESAVVPGPERKLLGSPQGHGCGWKGAMGLTMESLAGHARSLNLFGPQWEAFGGLQTKGTWLTLLPSPRDGSTQHGCTELTPSRGSVLLPLELLKCPTCPSRHQVLPHLEGLPVYSGLSYCSFNFSYCDYKRYSCPVEKINYP